MDSRGPMEPRSAGSPAFKHFLGCERAAVSSGHDEE